MKRNIWITVSYEGTAYAGFQRQPVAMTVQKAIEEALLQITGVSTTLYFVARTDAGVHAWGQECTFYTESRVPGDKFKYALNAILPRDIRVRGKPEVAEDFSVRRMNYGKRMPTIYGRTGCLSFYAAICVGAGERAQCGKDAGSGRQTGGTP